MATAGFSTAQEWLAEFGVLRQIVGIVWHDMEGHLAGALTRWNSGVADAHLSVLTTGEIVLTCLIENVAWHAGTNNDPKGGTYGRDNFWRTHNANPFTIGVELEGFAGQAFTPKQAASVNKIARWAEAKYDIKRVHTIDRYDGHHGHGELSSSRTDPGPTFNWDWVTK